MHMARASLRIWFKTLDNTGFLSGLTQNPGFDFSGAEISGNFHSGGPDFSSLQK